MRRKIVYKISDQCKSLEWPIRFRLSNFEKVDGNFCHQEIGCHILKTQILQTHQNNLFDEIEMCYDCHVHKIFDRKSQNFCLLFTSSLEDKRHFRLTYQT